MNSFNSTQLNRELHIHASWYFRAVIPYQKGSAKQQFIRLNKMECCAIQHIFACQNNAFKYPGDAILPRKTGWEQGDSQQVWELSSSALTAKPQTAPNRHRAKLVSFRELGRAQKSGNSTEIWEQHVLTHPNTHPLGLDINSHHTKNSQVFLAIFYSSHINNASTADSPGKKSYWTW